MKEVIRLLATGYLIKRFLAPRIYPLIDQQLAPWARQMRQVVAEEKALAVDRGEVISGPEMLIDGVVYARRRY
jgi:hypothetical protein